MRVKPKDRVVIVALAVLHFSAILALTQRGFAQPTATLSQAAPCTDSVDSDFCQKGGPNPCVEVPQNCFDYFRWFSNIIDCVDIPGTTVASGSTGNANVGWTVCQGGYIPGSTCSRALAVCGNIETYNGANCQDATYCGQVDMQACIGSSAVDCPPP